MKLFESEFERNEFLTLRVLSVIIIYLPLSLSICTDAVLQVQS